MWVRVHDAKGSGCSDELYLVQLIGLITQCNLLLGIFKTPFKVFSLLL
jgi:hypothetical protein